MDARWLARAAARTTLARFVGRGLALSTRVLRARAAGMSGRLDSGSVSVGGGASGGKNEGAVPIAAAMPGVGTAGGGHLSSVSLLLSPPHPPGPFPSPLARVLCVGGNIGS